MGFTDRKIDDKKTLTLKVDKWRALSLILRFLAIQSFPEGYLLPHLVVLFTGDYYNDKVAICSWHAPIHWRLFLF